LRILSFCLQQQQQVHERYTSKRCYWCTWKKSEKSEEPEYQIEKISESEFSELKAAKRVPKGRSAKGITRYKHDHRSCSNNPDNKERKIEGHPWHIYRDGGAAVNILNLAYYLCTKAHLGKMKLKDFHKDEQRPKCMRWSVKARD
jgi:hypothetical protein